MKTLFLFCFTVLIGIGAYAQTPINEYFFKPDSALVGTFTGSSASVDSLNDQLQLPIGYQVYFVSTGHAVNGSDGKPLTPGEKIYQVYDPNSGSYYALKVDPTTITMNKNVLEDVVYSKTQSDSRYLPAGGPISPVLIAQSSTYRLVNDTEKSTWSAKQNVLVSGTTIKTVNGVSVLGSGNITTSLSFSAPSAGNTITSGTAFQPRSGGPCFVTINSTLSNTIAVSGTVLVQMSATSGGTYTTISQDALLLSALLLTVDKSSGTIPVPAGYWLKVTYAGTPAPTGSYTRFDVN